jgi:hypothetical protein
MVSGLALTLDWFAFTPAAVTVTDAVCVMVVPSATAVTVFPAAACVELNADVATPMASVVGVAGLNVFPVPVALKLTTTPATGLPFASRAVTVIVLVLPPDDAVIVVGFAVTLDWPALTPPAVTVTVAVCVINTPSAVALIVLPCACVELNADVATPMAFVVGFAGLNVFPVPVEVNVTPTPETGLPN